MVQASNPYVLLDPYVPFILFQRKGNKWLRKFKDYVWNIGFCVIHLSASHYIVHNRVGGAAHISIHRLSHHQPQSDH
jgi:CRISPR/Cas system-associated protein endoribonuclease Cas2